MFSHMCLTSQAIHTFYEMSPFTTFCSVWESWSGAGTHTSTSFPWLLRVVLNTRIRAVVKVWRRIVRTSSTHAFPSLICDDSPDSEWTPLCIVVCDTGWKFSTPLCAPPNNEQVVRLTNQSFLTRAASYELRNA